MDTLGLGDGGGGGRVSCRMGRRDLPRGPGMGKGNRARTPEDGGEEDRLALLADLDRSVCMLRNPGLGISPAAFSPLLHSCALARSLPHGKTLHALLMSLHGLHQSPRLASLLALMYGRCSQPSPARAIFDRIPRPDCFSWNVAIAAHARNGEHAHALALYKSMLASGCPTPDKFTFLPVLSACAALGNLKEGEEVHRKILETLEILDISLKTALVNLYSKCGCLALAREMFDRIGKHDKVSWTSMISAYAKNGNFPESLRLFEQMISQGVKPNKSICLCLINASTSLTSLEHARAIHKCILASGFALDLSLENALINMYGKCNSVEDARLIFDDVHQRRNVVSWNAMITSYAHNGLCEEAVKLFYQMVSEKQVNPDNVTLVCVFSACAGLASLEKGRAVHEWVAANGLLDSDVAVKTALLNMYGRCGSIEDAQVVFQGMHDRYVITWNAMLTAYVHNGKGKEALRLFGRMSSEGGGVKPDRVTFLCLLNACTDLSSLEEGKRIHECVSATAFGSEVSIKNALLNMYGKCGSLKDARSIFDGMHKRDLISWNSMLTAYTQHGHGKEALQLLQQMDRQCVKPDKVTFLCLLSACANVKSLQIGKAIHDRISASGFKSDTTVNTALLNMYGKCGSLEDAQSVFDIIDQKHLFTWSAMIEAYIHNGQGEKAIALFWQMERVGGVKPDKVIFLSLLNACIALGSLEKGREIHECTVASGFDSDVSVANALLSMYAKCGSLREARVVFDKMHRRDIISWNAMLASFGQNGQGNEAIEFFQRMERGGVKPDKITFLCLLNACGHAGLPDEGLRYFISMSSSHGLTPLQEHYVCMIDMLGRVGYLNDAEDMVKNMPIQTDAVAWRSFLGACRLHGEVGRVVRAAERILQLDSKNAASYVLLSNIYAAANRWDDVTKLRELMEEKGMEKPPDFNWNEIEDNIATPLM